MASPSKALRKLIGLLMAISVILPVQFVSASGLATPAPLTTGGGATFPAPTTAVPGELLVSYVPGTSPQARDAVWHAAGLGLTPRSPVPGSDSLEVVKVPLGQDLAALASRLRALGGVDYAQPNYLYQPCAIAPNDPLFPPTATYPLGQWGLDNPVNPGIDIGVLDPSGSEPAAWDVTTGDPSVVVAVIDTGIDIDHPDLAGRIWTNPYEIPDDGIDNDGNGYIDDIHGWDFFWNDNSLFDSGFYDLHGTQVASVIAAGTNNAVGIAAVAPNVKIMPLKFIGPNGGSTALAIQAINYARANGAKVICAGWGSQTYDQALKDAIQAFGEAGGVFVAAAGNGPAGGSGYDTDTTPFYPAGYDLSCIVSVAAVDSAGVPLSDSNYGSQTVDLAAPGQDIIGAVPSQEPASGPAAIEISDPTPYKALLWGFGAENFLATAPGVAARRDAIGRALRFLDVPPGQKVLVVDDDGNDPAYGVEAQPYYSDGVAAYGCAYDIWTVVKVIDGEYYSADGPTAAQMDGGGAYAAVVWFTGEAIGGLTGPGGEYVHCLTPSDQANLTAYLRDYHGRLFLSGRDALFEIQNTSFVRDALHTWDANDVEELRPEGAPPHNGLAAGRSASEAGYAGADYSGQWLSPDNREHILFPLDTSARIGLHYTGGPYDDAYQTFRGTSAAAPFVAGVAALLYSIRPDAPPAEVVAALAGTTTQLASLTGRVRSGGMVNASRAVAAIGYGVAVTPVTLSLAEGGAEAEYTVVLRGVPSGTVTFTATPGPELSVDNGSGGQTLTFGAGDWNVPKTMKVRAVDDDIVEGLHIGRVAHAVTGGGYDGVSVSDLTATIADNDLPVVTVTGTGGSTAVTEGATSGQPGYSDTYTVVLGRQPSADVTIVATPDEQVTVDNGLGGQTLTFTGGPSGNWATPQALTVRAVDDTAVEGTPHLGQITHTASGGGYTGAAVASVTVEITDNDKPGLVIVESGGNTAVLEGPTGAPGTTDTYTVALNGPPTGDLTLTATCADGQVAVDRTDIAFDSGNWNVPQTVTVSSVEDALAEGLHHGIVTYTAAGGLYDPGTVVGSVDVVITDNEVAGVVVTEPDGPTAVTEGAASGSPGWRDTYTLALLSDPGPGVFVVVTATAPAAVRIAAGDYTGGGGTFGATASLAFDENNWGSPQPITVQAYDDPVVEGRHLAAIAHSATGGVYGVVAIANLTVVVTDNDPPVVLISETGGSTAVIEGAASGQLGYSDTYTVALGREPSGTVIITATADSQVTVSNSSGGSTLTFTGGPSGNWAVPQTLTVRAVADAVVDGVTATNLLHTGIITHAASGGGYTGAPINPVNVAITDDDIPSVVITQTGGSTAVTEGGATDTYTLVLGAKPSGTVTVTVAAELSGTPPTSKATVDTGAGMGTTATLTFSPLDWNVPKTVAVAAVDDNLIEGPHSTTISHTASGGGYAGTAITPVTVFITDNDFAGVRVTESGGSTVVTEGGARDSYTVVLTHSPNADVTITATVVGYDTGTPPQPRARLAVGDYLGGGGTFAPTAALVFTTANWNVPQTITVEATNDVIVEGLHAASVTHAASGGGYDGVPIVNVTATIVDDDAPGVAITEIDPATGGPDGSTQVIEGGANDAYTVALTCRPSGNVAVSIVSTAAVTAVGPSGVGALTFTTSNWNVPQRVTVAAVNDAIVEGDHSATITHSALGGGYSGVAIPNVTVSVTDDDVPVVTITELSPVTKAPDGVTAVTEGLVPPASGAVDLYRVALALAPCAPVDVTVKATGWDSGTNEVLVASGDRTAGGGTYAATAALTFTPANWNTPQYVTVRAVDDELIQGLHLTTIEHTATGCYAPAVIAPVSVTVTDDDFPGVTVAGTDGRGADPSGWTYVTEGAVPPTPGATDTYRVALTHRPNTDVTLTVTAGAGAEVAAGDCSGGGGSFGPTASLTFTGGPLGDWGTPQTITVRATDDAVVEGTHAALLTVATADAVAGSVSGYNALAWPAASVSVAITDDDLPVVNVTAGPISVTEGAGPGDPGYEGTYTVVLGKEPCGTVTVEATPQPNGAGAGSSVPLVVIGTGTAADGHATLTFTGGPAGNWSVPQTFTARAADDSIVELSPHVGNITHTATGGGYSDPTLVIASVSADVTDNDVPVVTITQTGGGTAVTEGAAQGQPGYRDTYSVVLGAQPAASVTVTATVSGCTGLGQGARIAAGDFGGGGGAASFGSSASLTFTPANWNQPQWLTVEAIDDLTIEGLHTVTVAHTASGSGYERASAPPFSITPVTVAITDNDNPGVTITPLNPVTHNPDASTAVTEGAAPGAAGYRDLYSVVLTRQPMTTVTVTATVGALPAFGSATVAAGDLVDGDGSGGGGDGFFGPSATLTFDQNNWNVAQYITVQAVDDTVVEGSPHVATIAHTSAGGPYEGQAWATLAANITDNDLPGVTVSILDAAPGAGGSGSLPVTEGAAEGEAGWRDTYTVVLDHEPCSDVTITVNAGAQLRVAAGDFTGAGGGGTFAQTVDLVFTAGPGGNWAVPQTVTVMAFDDVIAEGTHAGTITHTASGGGYGGVTIASVGATITDNDLPTVLLTETGGSTAVTEGATGSTPGATDTYTACLSHQPAGTVTVTVASSPSGRVQLSTNGTSWQTGLTLTFTGGAAGNWATPRTIYVRAVDDSVVEGPHTATVTHTASGGGYDISAPGSLTVNITDNDNPGVNISESGGSTRVTEGATPPASGATDTYTVVLTRQPCSAVTITAAAGPELEVAAGDWRSGGGVYGASATLTFTTANWNSPQTITVRAYDDLAVEGTHTGTITHSASGGAYDGAVIASVTATITDNDTAGVTLVQTNPETGLADGSTAVTEGAAPGTPGARDTYTVVLAVQPSGTVTITATASAQVQVAAGDWHDGGGTFGVAATLTFTPVNWNTPQVITVGATDDTLVEGPHQGTITHQAAGGGFTGAGVGSITVAVTDDDPGVIIVEAGGGTSVVEGETGDTYTLVLSTWPAVDVTVIASPDASLSVDDSGAGGGGGGAGSRGAGLPLGVVFTPANWNVPQTITVSAPADDTDDGIQTGTVGHTISTTDPGYTGVTVRDVVVTINEPAGAAGQTFDPREDTSLRFDSFGLILFIPAGAIPSEPGDVVRVIASVTPPGDTGFTQEGAEQDYLRAVGNWFELTIIVERGHDESFEVHELALPIMAVFDLGGLPLSGLDPDKIGLFTLEEAGGSGGTGGTGSGAAGAGSRWVFVPSCYDRATGFMVASLAHLSRFGVLVTDRSFGDTATHWARSNIETLAGRGVIQGVSPYLFSPQSLVTRAQFCALLVRALGLPKEGSGVTPFTDIPAGAWYAVEVHTAYDAGLVKGISATAFGPDRPITRQELAVLTTRALTVCELASPLSGAAVKARLGVFTDEPAVAAWARDGVALAIDLGIVRGRTATTIVPTGTATRAEAAVMLKRFMDKSMNLPVVVKGLLQVSEVEGQHYELVASEGGQIYALLVDPGRDDLLFDLQRLVGGTVTLVGRPDPDGISIYMVGVAFEVLMRVG